MFPDIYSAHRHGQFSITAKVVKTREQYKLLATNAYIGKYAVICYFFMM